MGFIYIPPSGGGGGGGDGDNLLMHHGENNFTGASGTVVTFPDVGDTSYSVKITPSANPAGYIGEWWYSDSSKTPASFKVFCSGDYYGSFHWEVLKNAQ